MRRRFDAEPAQIVDHDAALAFIRPAGQVPRLQRKAIAARRSPGAVPAPDERRLLQQLLRPAWVRPIAYRRGTGDHLVILLLGMGKDIAQDAGVVSEDFQQTLAVDRV